MKTLKKIVAGTSAIALLAMNAVNFTANAAWLDNAVATHTALDLGAGLETLTVTVAGKDFSWDAINHIAIYNNAWVSQVSVGAATSDLNGSFTLNTDLDALADNANYTVSFTTTAGDFGSAVLSLGTGNVITVSAQVEPVLSFAMQATALSLWTLTTSYAPQSTGLEVGTNAMAWLTVTATSTNGWLSSATNGHKIAGSANDALYSAEGYQFISTLGTADSVVWATINGLAANSVSDLTPGTTNVKTVYTNNSPENFDTAWDYDTDFAVQAKIASATPAAADYTDTITFTVTGNF